MNDLAVDKVGDKTRESVKWSLSLQIVQKIVFFGGSIILARLLTPKDFGLAAMAVTLDIIVQITSSMGINSAVIHFQDHTEERLDAAFWLYLVSMAVITCLQIFLAPLIAEFYKAPIMTDIVRVSAIAMFISSLGSVQKTVLVKNLEFKKTSIIETFTGILRSICYIVLALMGFGVWSFIYPKVIVAIVYLASIWNVSSWRPKFRFNFKYWLEMFKYGQNILMSDVIDYIMNNSSYILIGNLVGSELLGIYTFAYDKSMMMVNTIAYSAMNISFPAFSKLQDHKDKLKTAYFKTVKFISLISIPYSVGQIVLGQEYITKIFGEKWSSSVLIFQMLLVYSILRAISLCGTSILSSVGKPHIVLRWNLIFSSVFILSLYTGYKLGGINGVGAANAFIGSLGAIIFTIIVSKFLGWSFMDNFNALNPCITSSIIMGILLFALREIFKLINTPSVVILATLIPIGILIYFLSIKLLFRDTYDFILYNMSKFVGKPKGVQNVFSEQDVEKI